MGLERVLVFPRELADGFNGVRAFDEALWRRLMETAFFLPRKEAEESKTYKQLIPYCLIFDQDGKLLSYRRTSKGKETRLHAKYSVGVGGHINPEDEVVEEALVYRAICRELREEVGLLVEPGRLSFLGFVNDDDNPVGFVHFGLVVVLEISPEEEARLQFETTFAEARFLSLKEVWERREHYETWSSLVIEGLYQGRFNYVGSGVDNDSRSGPRAD